MPTSAGICPSIDENRVAPVLKEATGAGKINLTAIVNTHQYVLCFHHHTPAPDIMLTNLKPLGPRRWKQRPGMLQNSLEHADRLLIPAQQIKQLGVDKLDIIGGKDCEGVTKTPKHGETFKIGDISVKSVHTPCHTQDSICYFMEDNTGKAVFTGDTLFTGGKFNAILCDDKGNALIS